MIAASNVKHAINYKGVCGLVLSLGVGSLPGMESILIAALGSVTSRNVWSVELKNSAIKVDQGSPLDMKINTAVIGL